MRRFLFGVVIASVATAMPSWAFAGDREIAKAVMAELQQQKAAGNLKGFDLDLQVDEGIVYLEGRVASRSQRSLVAQAAADAAGVENVVNKIKVESARTEKKLPQTVVKVSETVRGKRKPVAAKPLLTSPLQLLTKSSRKSAQPLNTADDAAEAKATDVKPAAAHRPMPVMTDSEVTDAVISRLQGLQSAGKLRGFELDVNTTAGELVLTGQVASTAQKDMVIDTVRHTRGVSRVVDDIRVAAPHLRTAQPPVRQASTTGGLAHAAVAPAPVPAQAMIPQGSSMPTTGTVVNGPQAFAPSAMASAPMGYAPAPGAPVAMNGAVANYGAGAPRYDQPNMPNYAWPSYAAHPNYAAVTYPKQYSPSAWPYIGPFYPYPQVPLGWRKVSLEWDDGLWYLDFTSK